MSRQDWSEVLRQEDVDKKVEALHNMFEEATKESYEWRTRKKKSSEPVWMTDQLRDMIRKRRRLFRRFK